VSFPKRFLKPAPVLSPSSWIIGLSLVLLAPLQASRSELLPGSEHADGQQTAVIVSVQKHSEGRVFDWVRAGLNPIPLYDNYPFYDVTIEVEKKTFVVRYEAQTDYFPSAWKPGNTIKVRVAKGRMYLLRYDGGEVPVSILTRSSSHRPAPSP
jgi:hypothetical protein